MWTVEHYNAGLDDFHAFVVLKVLNKLQHVEAVRRIHSNNEPASYLQVLKDDAEEICEMLNKSEDSWLPRDYYIQENGRLLHHRMNGPAIISPDMIGWFQKGKEHRLDGPAIINEKGEEFWYNNGKLHRDDGPAFPREGVSVHRWWFDGKTYPFEEWLDILSTHKNYGPGYAMKMKLKWAHATNKKK